MIQCTNRVHQIGIPLEDAKHATNLFTVEAKHANLLGRLGPIFLVVPSHVCRSCKRRAFTVEKLHCRQLFILEHHFRFPYLTEDVRHSLSKRSFPRTDRHRSQLGCNDARVSIMYGHETGPDYCSFRCPTKKWGVCACANGGYQALFRGLGTRLLMVVVVSVCLFSLVCLLAPLGIQQEVSAGMAW